jgi:hypothetical protein
LPPPAAVIALFFGLGTWLVASQDTGDSDQSTAAASPAPRRVRLEEPTRLAVDHGRGRYRWRGQFERHRLRRPRTAESAKSAPPYLGAFADEAALRLALYTLATDRQARARPRPDSRDDRHLVLVRTHESARAYDLRRDLRGRPVTVVVTGTRADVYDNATCRRTNRLVL